MIWYENRDLRRLKAFRFMKGPSDPPDWFRSNGITCGPDFIPRIGFWWNAKGVALFHFMIWTVWLVDLRPAAHWHDWEYGAFDDTGYPVGGNEQDRFWADHCFLLNLRTCGLVGPIGWAIRRFMYHRLRMWGTFHFNYHPSEEPRRNARFFFWLLVGRYWKV